MRQYPTAFALLLTGIALGASAEPPTRELLWGDTHLHTKNSFDAFLFMNRSIEPDDAYRYAKGLPVIHPFHRARVQIETPLDFLVVSDHAELLGVPRRIFEQDPQVLATEFGQHAAELLATGKANQIFTELVSAANAGDARLTADLVSAEMMAPVWHNIADSADRHNTPGEFTAIIGWEWSSTEDAANLHRIVLMDGDAQTARQFTPYSNIESPNPEDLWRWLDGTESRVDATFVAIPHNMNISKAKMFDTVTFDGSPLTPAWAETRKRWEPIVEMTQIKGDSETHPLLSPEDEFAEFETYRHLIDTRPDTDHTAPVTAADYVRPAMLRGLSLERDLGVNPYQFGVIGSTDSHTGLSSAEENNFHGKMALDSIPEKKAENRIGKRGATGWDMSASGLAAVWADTNTRKDIIAAFKRKEVYASSGPRIAVRLFGGADFEPADAEATDFADRGYARGVPMGGELNGLRQAPRFIIQAFRDPKTIGLDRIQIIKGWIDSTGKTHEQVFNVAASDDRFDPTTGEVAAIDNTVDQETARFDTSSGASELLGFWQDPNFNPAQPSFYYARVLQAPTPRHTLYDEVALKTAGASGQPASIQERAYTSAIWYHP